MEPVLQGFLKGDVLAFGSRQEPVELLGEPAGPVRVVEGVKLRQLALGLGFVGGPGATPELFSVQTPTDPPVFRSRLFVDPGHGGSVYLCVTMCKNYYSRRLTIAQTVDNER